MDGLGLPLLALIAWVIFGVIRNAARAAGELEKRPPPPPDALQKSLPGMNPDFLEMLRELERASRGQQRPEPAVPPAPRPAPVPRPAARPGAPPPRRAIPAPEELPEFVENVESLEVAAREEVSLDAASEAAARRRREAAERRDRPRTAADHAAFDARIRAEPEKAPASGTPALEGVARLRSALVWNELLGPPVSLRDERGPTSR
ncbi:MAG: hypothetical protein ACM357_06060 [Gemmatimonadota bacterium]